MTEKTEQFEKCTFCKKPTNFPRKARIGWCICDECIKNIIHKAGQHNFVKVNNESAIYQAH